MFIFFFFDSANNIRITGWDPPLADRFLIVDEEKERLSLALDADEKKRCADTGRWAASYRTLTRK